MKHLFIERKRNNLKFAIFLAVLGAFLMLAVYSIIKINEWFDNNRFVFKSPIVIKLQAPVSVVKRKPDIRYIREFIASLPKPETTIEKYICDKFGSECQIALLIAKLESGIREEAININDNGSIDIGIFQINSVHWKKEGCRPKELFDAYKNVDCAYKIYKSSGWDAWSAYKKLKIK